MQVAGLVQAFKKSGISGGGTFKNPVAEQRRLLAPCASNGEKKQTGADLKPYNKAEGICDKWRQTFVSFANKRSQEAG